MKKNILLATTLLSFLLITPNVGAKVENNDEVLVTIDGNNITRANLKAALASSPFYTQFNTLNEKNQALVRGDLLKRLVTSHLLKEEAKKLKIADSDEFKKDLAAYTEGLSYRRYVNNIRKSIKISEDDLNDIRKKYTKNPDAITAAKSQIITSKFKALLKLTLMKLRDSFHVKVYEDRINKDITNDTVLMEGNDGLKLTYGELIKGKPHSDMPDKAIIQEQLYKQVEFLLLSKAAKEESYDFSQQIERYKEERLAAALIEKKKKEWIPNEETLKTYYSKHPKVGVVSDRWHIGQVVLKTKEKAEKALQKIKSGKKSIFQLAGELSIDPYGKEHNGDMGWVKQGTGMPAIEKELKDLKDGEISDIIETSKGFHIVTILKRRPGETMGYNGIKDKLTQMLLSEKLSKYLQELQKKHTVTWQVMETDPNKAKALLKSKGI